VSVREDFDRNDDSLLEVSVAIVVKELKKRIA